ncbi:hypothetical protein FB45DRAFT_73778 [Roridomyces roridus]|uniref:Uncharacterized protein n=1 Tax=Roridomyces roridus TaxID=1738132 RepID=A0AAD7BN59_9AGAR|nr:hypothetical protein FB45DRAFT_73778 [Roridomyces roridus]
MCWVCRLRTRAGDSRVGGDSISGRLRWVPVRSNAFCDHLLLLTPSAGHILVASRLVEHRQRTAFVVAALVLCAGGVAPSSQPRTPHHIECAYHCTTSTIVSCRRVCQPWPLSEPNSREYRSELACFDGSGGHCGSDYHPSQSIPVRLRAWHHLCASLASRGLSSFVVPIVSPDGGTLLTRPREVEGDQLWLAKHRRCDPAMPPRRRVARPRHTGRRGH